MKKFPIGVNLYEFHCDNQLTDEVLKDIKTKEIHYLKSQPHNTKVPNNYGMVGYMDKNYQIPYYHEKLFDWFQECVDKVIADTIPNTNLIISDSWVTKLNFGQHASNVHVHSNSVCSGLFYLTTHKKSYTNFYPKNSIAECMTFESNSFVQNNSLHDENSVYMSYPESGKLLIFPSSLAHNVSVHNEPNIRHTIAFNTYYQGRFGEPTTYLQIKVKSVKEIYEDFINGKSIC